jgi:hypothetical protein
VARQLASSFEIQTQIALAFGEPLASPDIDIYLPFSTDL